jgi:uncharacterized protein (DUF983 family)
MTTAAPRRGFKHTPCPKCGEDGIIQISLDDVGDCHCNECGEDFTLADIRAFIEAWTPIMAWLATCPVRAE